MSTRKTRYYSKVDVAVTSDSVVINSGSALTDADGDKIDFQVAGGTVYLPTKNNRDTELLEDILVQLKKLNMYMEFITDIDLNGYDPDDGEQG